MPEPAPAGSEAAETEAEVRGLARGGGLNLVGAAFSQAALLAITLVLARQLGQTDVGRYAQAFAFLSLLGLLSLSGFRAGLTRFVAVHRAENDPGALRGTVRLGLGVTAGSAFVLGVGLFALAPTLAHDVFGDPGLQGPLRFVACILPLATFADAALAATQGWKTMRPFALIGLIFEPAARVLLTVAFVLLGGGLLSAMAAILISQAMAAVLAAGALRRLMRPANAAAVYNARELFSFSMVSWLASLASTGLIWADTILLGILTTSAQVGVYNVATRIVTLATFVMAPINASFAPRIADLYQRRRHRALARTYAVATGWILRLALPSFVVLVVFPDQILRLFGPGFVVGATATVVLACGKLVDAGTGPCGLMLNMSGRPKLNLLDNAGVLILNVALNLWLIPRYGIVGSAWAWAISLTLVNAARVLQVWATMRMAPFDRGVAKGLAAGAGALAVGLGVTSRVHGLTGLVLGSALVLGTYAVLLAALGLSSEDRVVLEMLAGRVGLGRARSRAGPRAP